MVLIQGPASTTPFRAVPEGTNAGPADQSDIHSKFEG